MEQNKEYPGSWYQPLFDHLYKEHGKISTQSEMDEISRIVRDMDMQAAFTSSVPELKEEIENKVVALMTEVMREADQVFQKTGGSTRHYIRDVFLPILQKSGACISLSSLPSGQIAGESADLEILAKPFFEADQLRNEHRSLLGYDYFLGFKAGYSAHPVQQIAGMQWVKASELLQKIKEHTKAVAAGDLVMNHIIQIDHLVDQGLKESTSSKEGSWEEQYHKLFALYQPLREKMDEIYNGEGSKEAAIAFLDQIRDYERENRKLICFDERSSAELFDLFLQSQTNK